MPNIWTQFKSLIPEDVTLVATVSSTDGATSTVELLSGDMLSVRGTGTINAKVYIKGGEIIQEVGTLNQYNMILY